MSGQDISVEIEKLRADLRRHERLYYVDDAPEISDAEFDAMMARLKQLEKENPQFDTEDSPTRRVGGARVSAFAPVPHRIPMLSLDNTYSAEGFTDWYDRTLKLLGEPFAVTVEKKIDGLSCSVEYRDGRLFRASTRGDGNSGEDVTANVRTIRSVPLVLPAENPPAFFEARGEVYIDKADFVRLSEEAEEAGEAPFVNPRNAAAGSLRQKDPKITACRRLKFIAHSYGYSEGFAEPDSHREYLEICRSFGFNISTVGKELCAGPGQVLGYYARFEKERFELPFEIDGLVIKVDSLRQRSVLGNTSKSPRWAIALKYPPRQAETKLLNVEFSVGRTGVITPVAGLRPVQCAGVTISSATLHNFDEVKRLGIKTGDTVVVERAGEVIPKVVRARPELRRGNETDITAPSVCPSCGSEVFFDTDGVALRCPNPSCPAQFKRALLHFAAREAMAIDGLGESAADQLIDKKMVGSFPDVYRLRREDLLSLKLFKDRKAEKLLLEIEESKKRPLSRLIFALGIRHIGEKNARVLAARYKDMNGFMYASEAELSSIPDIGPVIAASVTEFFKSDKVRDMIKALALLGLNMKEDPRTAVPGGPLNGKTFVFTGELDGMTRQEAAELVRALGGTESSSVSSKTSYVVAGSLPGSKYAKALKLGVRIINKEDFLKIIGENEKK